MKSCCKKWELTIQEDTILTTHGREYNCFRVMCLNCDWKDVGLFSSIEGANDRLENIINEKIS